MIQKNFLLPLAIGLVGGCLSGYLIANQQAPQSIKLLSAERQSELADVSDTVLIEKIRTLESKNAGLRASVEQDVSATNGSVVFANAVVTNKRPSEQEMLEASRPHFQNMATNQLARMDGRLKLSNQQKTALAEVLVLQHEMNLIYMESRFRADEKGERFEETDRISDADVLAYAKEVLDPVQYEEFADIKESEKQTRNDIMATARLSQLTPMLDLSEEQKNEAYSIYYSSADKIYSIGDPLASVEIHEAANEAVEEILTSEQLASYRKYSEREDGRRNFRFLP